MADDNPIKIPEMVERVAQRLYDGDREIYSQLSDKLRKDGCPVEIWADVLLPSWLDQMGKAGWYSEARAAVAAMREPTGTMVSNLTARNAHSTDVVWRAMIDAALGE